MVKRCVIAGGLYWISLTIAIAEPVESDVNPSPEFLQFLAQFELQGGQWVGPQEVEEMAVFEHPEQTIPTVKRNE